eukprot:1138373-Pelagomonas_calceolata.AAC.1
MKEKETHWLRRAVSLLHHRIHTNNIHTTNKGSSRTAHLAALLRQCMIAHANSHVGVVYFDALAGHSCTYADRPSVTRKVGQLRTNTL